MRKIYKLMVLSVCICLLTAVTGCGQKGPLYLPEGSALTQWLG